MKFKFFLIRSISIAIMLILTLVSLVLAVVMSHASTPSSGDTLYFPWMLFGDELVPLLFFIPALIFRSRMCTLAAIITSFMNIFIRTSAIILFNETFMPLDYHSLKILWQHTDLYALEAAFGEHFIYWLIPLLLMGGSVVIYCCILSWKTAGKSYRRVSRKWVFFFSILLGLSLISNLLFLIFRMNTPESYLASRPLPIVSADLTNVTLRKLYERKDFQKIPLPESSQKILKEMNIIPAEKVETRTGTEHFDRIIIIAVESLDFSFIGALNPQMPPGITPELDKLTGNYPSMKNYFAAAQPTSWALNALLLSRLDYDKDRYMDNLSLFSILKSKDFYSYYFSAASGKFGENRRIYKSTFFPDEQFFLEEWESTSRFIKESDWGLSDKTLFEGVFEQLKNSGKKRFIALISTMDTHPDYYSCDLTDEEKRNFPTPFLQALHNCDREIGKFVRKLTADPELYNDRTLIVITADHTATHGENFLKRKNFTPARIPLIFICRDQNIFAGLDTGKFASSIDLAPTLLHLTGCQIPETFIGRALFSPKNMAISRVFGDVLLLNTPAGEQAVNTREEDTPDKTAQAFRDLYHSHYGR